jgi:hypothetical protein
MTKYDFNKCTKEQLVKCLNMYHDAPGNEWFDYKKELDKVAEVKLRTRAEVDADIAKVIRDYHALNSSSGTSKFSSFNKYVIQELNKLCTEETQG